MSNNQELRAEDVLADLFAEEGFEIADANGAAEAAVRRLEDAGFRIFDASEGAATVLGYAHHGADNRMWSDFAKAVLRVPPDMVPEATAALRRIAEGRSA
jgi:hypothetical protein